MLKFLLLELVKSYANNIKSEQEKKKQYSDYFIGAFVGIALILLMVANYLYFSDTVSDYIVYIQDLLIISTILLWGAVIIKLVEMWLIRREKRKAFSVENVFSEIAPVVVSMIPMGVVAYILWAKIQTKFPGKALRLKNTIKRLF